MSIFSALPGALPVAVSQIISLRTIADRKGKQAHELCMIPHLKTHLRPLLRR